MTSLCKTPAPLPHPQSPQCTSCFIPLMRQWASQEKAISAVFSPFLSLLLVSYSNALMRLLHRPQSPKRRTCSGDSPPLLEPLHLLCPCFALGRAPLVPAFSPASPLLWCLSYPAAPRLVLCLLWHPSFSDIFSYVVVTTFLKHVFAEALCAPLLGLVLVHQWVSVVCCRASWKWL